MTPPRHPLIHHKLDSSAAPPAAGAPSSSATCKVDGFYSRSLLGMGFSRVVLVDLVETARWVAHRLEAPAWTSIRATSPTRSSWPASASTSTSVAFDVLLHQPTSCDAHHMASKVDRLCIVQPMIEERAEPATVVYLPGNGATPLLHPFGADSPLPNPVDAVDAGHWIWAVTPSFLRHAMAGEGFEIVHEARYEALPNPSWFWWGCIADRGDGPVTHWSRTPRQPGLFPGSWPAQE